MAAPERDSCSLQLQAQDACQHGDGAQHPGDVVTDVPGVGAARHRDRGPGRFRGQVPQRWVAMR
ncbi:MAG TPA: hypothetical protein VEF72_15450 [Mycobacterium sp.]|nr:hypothetical protein [Mycobacterium sp.]